MSAPTLAPQSSTIQEICAENDTATRMSAIMQREDLYPMDVEMLINDDFTKTPSNILAMAKNPHLDRKSLFLLWGELVESLRGNRHYLSMRYILSHPGLSRRDAMLMIEMVPMRMLDYPDIDVIAQLMTCPHLSRREWKSLARKLFSLYRSAAFEQGASRMLSGIHNTMDPTALMGDEPSLTSPQLAYLYLLAENERRSTHVDRGTLRRQIMKHPNAPQELRYRLVREEVKADHYSLAGLAANPTVTIMEMAVIRVALWASKDVRALATPSLAGNPRTTFLPDVFSSLQVKRGADNYSYQSPQWKESVLRQLFENPSTDAELFNHMLKEVSVEDLEKVFSALKLDPFDDFRIAEESKALLSEKYVEAGVVLRSSWLEDMEIPEESALEMFDAASGQSRIETTQKTQDPTLLAHAARDRDYDVRVEVAKNKLTSVQDLVMLSQDEDSQVRRATVWNDRTPESALLMLAKDPAHEVKMSLAQRKALPESVQRILMEDPSWRIRRYVHGNRSVLQEIREHLDQDPRIQEEKGKI